ncbi:heparin lyase I family protein [Motilibacter deserti]|uniref:Polysaccharide lyase-like protein n=1 Tax=Motilibacter deserti TaxID=2714956 RepID=A0ABX0GTH7_9ACTN|nr:hypothetical protein [Motilibacter deserti]
MSGCDVPGAGAYKPSGSALRVELRPFESAPGKVDGDVTNTGGHIANRSEVFGRVPTGSLGGTPASEWPDPVGAERWYAFNLFVPSDFQTATDTTWLTLMQWKGLYGGSPPVALEVKRGNLRLGGARTNQGLVPNDGNLGPLAKGTWTRLVVGMRLSSDAKRGWVQVYRDGKQALPRVALATMDNYKGVGDGAVDPIYVKQGIYRDLKWNTTHVLYFGPLAVGQRYEDVA